MNSSALRPCAPETASVPKTIFTPLARARRSTSAVGASLLQRLNGLLAEVEARGIFDIVVQYEEIRVEVRPALDHQVQRGVLQKRAVFDGGATGQHRGAGARIADRVDHATQSSGLG